MYMNIDKSIIQKLTRKIVLVAIKNQQSQLLLRRHPKNNKHNAGLWDISIYSHVYANESCEDAALRGLYEQFELHEVKLDQIAFLPYLNHNDIPFIASVFMASKLKAEEQIRLLNSVYTKQNEIMFISIKELKSIIEHSQELFTPELIWASQANWIL